MKVRRAPGTERLEPDPRGPEGGPRAALAAVFVLLVALAGFVVVVQAFRGPAPTSRPATIVQNGRIAFASFEDSDWQIFSVKPDGTGVTRLTNLSTDQSHPAWSPDGTRIAFDAQGEDGRMEIDVMNADGSDLQPLTDGPGWNYLPDWSPDGTRMAFVSNRDGNDEIYVMNADGSDQTRLTVDPEEDLSPAWSPDGTQIAFQSNREGFNRIYVMNDDGSGVVRLTDAEGFDPTWSRDGGRVAFARTTDGNPEIYVANIDGSGVARLTDDPSHDWNPSWSPDGSKIAFQSDPDGQIGIYVMNSDGSDVSKLVDTSVEACCPAWQSMPTGGETPPPSETPSPLTTPSPVDPHVTATISVGDSANAVAVGEGSVWVSVPSNDGSGTGQILRVDPATNSVVAKIPVVAIPTWETGGGGLAVGAGSVWVTSGAPARDLGDEPGGGWEAGLLRIDPNTNQVTASIPLGGDFGADVAVGKGAVWVLIFSGENSMRVLRVDPSTEQVAATIPVRGVWGQEIFATAEGAFINTRDPFPGEDSTVGASRLTMIDPATNEVRWTLPDTAFVESFQSNGVVWAQGGGTKYANVGGENLSRLDPRTGRVLGEPIPVGRYGEAFVVAPDGGVWFSGSDHHGWTIGRFNPVTNTVDASVATGDFTQDNRWWPVAVALGSTTNTIWLVHYGDNVTRIDLAEDFAAEP